MQRLLRATATRVSRQRGLWWRLPLALAAVAMAEVCLLRSEEHTS